MTQEYSIYEQLTSCRVALTSNLSANYFNGECNSGVGATLTSVNFGALIIDGVSVNEGDRVLISNQLDPFKNGIYVVINRGNLASFFVLKRSNDFQSLPQRKEGMFFAISDGNTNKGAIFQLAQLVPPMFIVSSSGGTAALKSASNPLLPIVASVFTPTNFHDLVTFADTNGSVIDTGYLFSINRANSSGGANVINIDDPDFRSGSFIKVCIQASTNPVSILTVAPALGTVAVTMSGPPGPGTVFGLIGATMMIPAPFPTTLTTETDINILTEADINILI